MDKTYEKLSYSFIGAVKGKDNVSIEFNCENAVFLLWHTKTKGCWTLDKITPDRKEVHPLSAFYNRKKSIYYPLETEKFARFLVNLPSMRLRLLTELGADVFTKKMY